MRSAERVESAAVERSGPRADFARVLMLLENCSYPRDGRVRQEARALVEAGYLVSVVCPAAPGQPRREILDQVRVYRYPAPPEGTGFLSYLLEYVWSLAASLALSLVVLRREGFDVVHAHNPPDTFVFLGALYRLFGKRFVYDHHDLAPEMYQARFPGRGDDLVYRSLLFLEKLSCRLADHVIATNESYRLIAIRRGGVPAERVTIVRNGPDLTRLRVAEPSPELRAEGRTVICYVGVVGFQDGVDYLVRALGHLLHDLGRTDFVCAILGDGAALRSVRALAEQLGVTDHVLFAGWVPHREVARYLTAADICASPDPSNSYNDRSTTIKIMEYMALGKPIVAFDLPESRYSAREAACYARPNDELEFARGLAALMDDSARRAAMGAFGQRRVATELAWPHSVPSLLHAYAHVSAGLTRRRPPRDRQPGGEP